MTRLFSLAYLWAQWWPGPERRPWEWHFAWAGGKWGLLLLLAAMILFWGILIGGVTLVVRLILSLGRDRKGADALAILKQRYARGEIDRDEYERMRKELSV
ncbi:MAG TPA: SHOCT domain-containing protein [Candidatus Binatia bacterium]|nr:SHOCT domain-containing protein [Candidatus Binatia bacterium]